MAAELPSRFLRAFYHTGFNEPGRVRLYFLLVFSVCSLLPLNKIFSEGIAKPMLVNPDFSVSSSLNPAYLDLAVPGYGMFAQKEYIWGSVYTGLKIGGGVLIYLSVKNYLFWNSASNSAAIRQSREPDPLQFSDPRNNGGFLTARELQNKSDTAFLNILYAGLLEIAVYCVSYWHSDNLYHMKLEKGKFFYRVEKDNDTGEMPSKVELGWQTDF